MSGKGPLVECQKSGDRLARELILRGEDHELARRTRVFPGTPRLTRRHILIALSALIAVPTAAVADEPRQSGSEVVVIDDTYDESVLGPGFRTVVKVDEREGETTSIAEVLASSVGVHVRSLGDLGGFSSLSIRGASPSHTAVFVDGVPLSRIAFAAQDLGVFELSSFSELEVYRGAVPVEFGGAAMGGAVNLRTRLGRDANGDIARLSAGFGSFGARHLRARIKDSAFGGKLAYHTAIGYRATTGDYRYFNDNGTPLIAEDDAMMTRSNNGFDQLYGLARARYSWRDTLFELGSRTTFKDQQLPGVGSVQSYAASLSSFSELVDAQLRYAPPGGRTHAQANAYLLFERQRYRDLQGEIGIGTQDNRYQTLSIGTTARVRHRLGERHIVALSSDGRLERYVQHDMLSGAMPGPRGWRWNTGVSASDDIALTKRLHLVPALRFDHQYTDPGDGWDPVVAQADELDPRSEAFVSPRLALRLLVGGGAVIKASAGRYFRAPTLTELFGDRGFIVGNPTLESERGSTADFGFVFAPNKGWGALSRVYAQVAGFVAKPESAIVLMPASGGASLSRNLGDATLYGLETAITARVGNSLTFTGNYTLIESRQDSPLVSYDGKRLPLRPRHDVYARVDAIARALGRRGTVWADLAFTSGNFLDAANNSQVPHRLLLGAGLKARLSRHLLLGVEVKNLTNTRVESISLDPPPRPDLATVPRAVSDFLGYPLPGRAFYVSAETTF